MQSQPRLTHICPTCGKTFSDIPSRQRVYCSLKCKHVGWHERAQTIRRVCDYCGKTFSQHRPSEWKRDPQRFCSKDCSGKGTAKERGLHVRKEETFICEHCGQIFSRMARADRAYRFCSRKCSWAYQRGEKHRCWQGGTDRYYGPNWDEQRLKALERDDYTCQHCGVSEKGMNVHHKILRSEFGRDWEAMNRLSNLLTLCHPCHARVHVIRLNGPKT